MTTEYAITALGVVRKIALWGAVAPEELGLATTFGQMEYDSLDHVELAMAIEDPLNITVPDSVINTWGEATSISDIGAAIRKIVEDGK